MSGPPTWWEVVLVYLLANSLNARSNPVAGIEADVAEEARFSGNSFTEKIVLLVLALVVIHVGVFVS